MQGTIHRIFRLSEPSTRRTVRFLSGLHVSLADGNKQTWVTVTRTGLFTDPRYGRFEITRDMLLSMVSNFKSDTFGQKIFIDVSHKPQDGAAGEIRDLAVEGNRLRALVEWTPLGADAVNNRRMVYLSAEYIENFKDNEEGNQHGPVLLGAALTTRPVIKHQDAITGQIQLSEQSGDSPVLVHPELIKSLAEEAKNIMNKHLKLLLAALATIGLPDAASKTLGDAFMAALGDNTDEEHAATLLASFEDAGKKLAEELKANPNAIINLSMPTGESGLSAEDVKKLLAEHEDARAQAAKKLTETREAKVKLFADTVDAAEGLDETTKKSLCESVEGLITETLTDDQVVALATLQIKQANDTAVARQLSGMGFPVGGSPHITPGEDTTVKALQEQIDGAIGIKHESVDPFVSKILAEFDRTHALQLANERKQLAGGSTGIADSNLPAGFQRTVIRQALSDLNILNLVNALTDFGASATVNIPYEQRDTSAVVNDGIVYEGQGIPGASIKQLMDIAYVTPMKLALKVSNEVAFFSRNNQNIDWDAYARNVASNARVVRELLAKRIANELQRSADAYAPTAHSDTLTSQVDGATSTFKTSFFPMVRPHQNRDLKGTAVGTAENPITVTLGGTGLAEYDGTNTQASGTYYRVTNYNLGYVQTVSELGAAVTPTASTALVIAYSEATNVAKFDLDVPSGTALEDHLNGLLRTVGARKAILTSDRFVSPQNMFMLMSGVLNDTITNAKAFVESQAKIATQLSAAGDLSTIKNVPSFGTNAPAIDLGDERIVMGEAGLLAYAIVKPFATGTPFEAVDANGLPTGEKVAYGEEYDAIHMPLPLRNRLTSALAYSFTGR